MRSIIQRSLFILLITGVLCLFFLSLQPIGLGELMGIYLRHPSLFLNNYYPVLLLSIFLIGVTGRISFSIKGVYLLFSILGLLNRMKIIYRDFPLLPFDLLVAREGGSIVVSSGYSPDWPIVILILVGFVLLWKFLSRFDFSKIDLKGRIIGSLSSALIFALLFLSLYSSRDYYAALPVGNDRANYNEALSSNLRGFHYYFLYSLSAQGYTIPEGYDEEMVEKLEVQIREENKEEAEESLRRFNEAKKPNIIFIMGEAFTDISREDVFDFPKGYDPLSGYKEMEEESILSGHLITPVFGAGTEYTEYDVLTANMTTYQSEGYVSPFRSLEKKTPSLGWFFKDLAYDTYGMHPGDPWFYNRQNAYVNLGLDNNYFNDDFDNPHMKGNYISDKEFGQRIKDDFENHQEQSSNPLFYFSVTLQNHGPYEDHKYEEEERFDYDTKVELEPEEREQLDNLFVGIKDMSDTLKDLGDYFSKEEEPVIMVYFGDHQPALGEDFLAYRAIDYDVFSKGGEEFFRSRTTPYLIWANESGEEYLDLGDLNLPEDNRISANYLGLVLLDMLNLERIDPYYSYINDIRKSLPVLSTSYLVRIGEEGSAHRVSYEDLRKEELEKIEGYKKWQYKRIK